MGIADGHGRRWRRRRRRGLESVYYVKSGNEQQYKILPVQMTVLIDQDHVQDLLIELENSPMSIQVKDFELQRPTLAGHQARERNRPVRGMEMGGMNGRMMMECGSDDAGRSRNDGLWRDDGPDGQDGHDDGQQGWKCAGGMGGDGCRASGERRARG